MRSGLNQAQRGDLSRRGFALLLGLGLAAGGGAARSQGDAARTVRLIVPFAAAGPADILARALARGLAERLGQPVIVENRPGAGGTLGADAVAKAPPDGLTLLLATSSTHSVAPVLARALPYDAAADFTPVAALADAAGVVLVSNALPVRSLREFIDHARSRPGRLSYASSGNGTIVHLSTEYFMAETGLSMLHVPYRGTALALTDLAAGTVDVLFDSLVTGLAQARDGKARALAVTGRARSPLAPALPTVADTVPGYDAATWFGVFGPRGLPPAVVERLNAAVNAVLREPEMQQRLAALGAEPTGGSASALAQRMHDDTEKWRRIVATRGIKVE